MNVTRYPAPSSLQVNNTKNDSSSVLYPGGRVVLRLSTHFKREEFSCKCGCGWDTVDAELLTVLQWLRYETGKPVTINSGCRCKAYNQSVGGAQRSQHLYGRAADIVVAGMLPEDVYQLIHTNFPERFGLIRYKSFVHVDTRNFRLRM